jgi:hypothetical protein
MLLNATDDKFFIIVSFATSFIHLLIFFLNSNENSRLKVVQLVNKTVKICRISLVNTIMFISLVGINVDKSPT